MLGCSLNDSNFDSGPKPGAVSNDQDFMWDLWPELDENKELQNLRLEDWPEIKKNSVLFLGDESLQTNWGLVLKNNFATKTDESWFLSTCMTARNFKNGNVSGCGYWTAPFLRARTSGTFITVDQQESSERLAPKILSDSKVKKVILSFGHKIKAMRSDTEIQNEISAIELMAKWAHSAGKKCYVIEPVDSYYVETRKNNFLTSDQISTLKRAISIYCDWIDAKKLIDEYQNTAQVPIDNILDLNRENPSEDYISAPKTNIEIDQIVSPEQSILDETLDETLGEDAEGLEIPKNNLNPDEQVLRPSESMAEMIERLNRERQDSDQPVTEESENKSDKDKVLTSSLRPKPRPERISQTAQEQIRLALEGEQNGSDQIVRQQELNEPRYLWNGHNNGDKLTEIGIKYIKSDTASFLIETKNLKDVENFCPNYWKLSDTHREYFWIYLFSAVARYENHTFNPRALHQEKASGRHSIGIFQVDTKNCGYGSDSNREKLFDLDNNFKCALTKGASLVKQGDQVADGRYVDDRYSDYGLDGYWSVLRKPYRGAAMNASTGTYQNVSLGRRQKIIDLTKSINICQ